MRDDKTYSVYVHKVDTENGPLYYTGVTKNLKGRWKPSAYKDTSLLTHIEQYGWKNIEHVVMFESDDREKALKIEDMLICMYSSFGCCINEQRSGHISVLDRKTYKCELYANNHEYAERMRQHKRDRYANDYEYAEHMRQNKRNKYANCTEYAEHMRQLERDRRATPEGKIYNRVHNFNRRHPDLAVETPKEARDNYLKYHIIPQYIKHDDL